MTSTDLKLESAGTLQRPGPVGRVVRVLFGVFCVWYVAELFGVRGNLFDAAGHVRSTVWNGVLPGLILISYVINIGYSRSWKKWPALLSVGVFSLLAAYGFIQDATLETPALAHTLWFWEVYLFSHLGLSFLLSAIIATPGCEMRAIHDAYSRLTGKPTKEHYCPIGPLSSIDAWESNR